jgi:hypothetical protein
MEQNKTGRYFKYALGEIILVVIGILIAFQVNEWSNQRNKAKAEEIVLTQLQNDLKKSQIELEEIIDVYRERTRASSIIRRAFWKTETPHDSIGKYLDIPGITRIYSPILGTARSLISSGNIDLLRSYELKNDIVSYVEKVDAKLIDIKRHEESYFRKGKELIFEVMPNTYRSKEDYIKRFEETPPEALKAYFENDFVGIPIDFDKVPFQSDFNALFQNEKFYLAYTKLYISHYNMYNMYGEILELTNDLLKKLNDAKVTGDDPQNKTEYN